jgi:hypothetical protein
MRASKHAFLKCHSLTTLLKTDLFRHSATCRFGSLWAVIFSCVRQVLQKSVEVLSEVEVRVASRTDCRDGFARPAGRSRLWV